LFEGLLAGFEGIPLRKRIRAVLKSLDGFKGIGFGPSLKPNPIGVLGFFLRCKLALRALGMGFP
jgi:hypothetical protein